MVQSFPTQTPIPPPPQITRRLEIHVHLDIVSRANLVGVGFAKQTSWSVPSHNTHVQHKKVLYSERTMCREHGARIWLVWLLFIPLHLVLLVKSAKFARFFAGSGRRRRGEWRAFKQHHHHRWLDVPCDRKRVQPRTLVHVPGEVGHVMKTILC